MHYVGCPLMSPVQPSCVATKCGETGTTRGGINFVEDSAALTINRVNKNSTSTKQETGSVSLNPLSLTITQSWAEKKKSGSKCQTTQLKQNGNVLSIVLLNTALSKASCSLQMKRFENYDLFSKPLAPPPLALWGACLTGQPSRSPQKN